MRYFYYSSKTKLSERCIYLNLLFNIQPTTFHEEIIRREILEENWTEIQIAQFLYQIANGLKVFSNKSSLKIIWYIFSIFMTCELLTEISNLETFFWTLCQVWYKSVILAAHVRWTLVFLSHPTSVAGNMRANIFN